MKHYPIMFSAAAVLTASAFAGTSETYTAPAPIQEQSIASGGWFIGGSFGQLSGVDHNGERLLNDSFDFNGLADEIFPNEFLDGGSFSGGDIDFDMYTLHVGRSWGSGFYGFATSIYLEVGYLNGDTDVSYNGPLDGLDRNSLDVDQAVIDALDDLDSIVQSPDIDIDIIPVTLNFMAERNLVGGLGLYLSAGAGYAFTDIDAFGESDTDGGFIAQASAGLVYNFNESFEMFGGARWMYLDSLNFGDSDLELDDSFAWEIGARVNF